MPSRVFVRDDGETEVEVDYTVRGGSEASGLCGLPEDYDPGEAPEIIIEDAWLLSDADRKDAPRVDLTDAETERFEQEVCEDPETWRPDEPDYD